MHWKNLKALGHDIRADGFLSHSAGDKIAHSVIMTRNKLVGNTAGATLPMLSVGMTHSGHPTHIKQSIQHNNTVRRATMTFRSPLSILHTGHEDDPFSILTG